MYTFTLHIHLNTSRELLLLGFYLVLRDHQYIQISMYDVCKQRNICKPKVEKRKENKKILLSRNIDTLRIQQYTIYCMHTQFKHSLVTYKL